MSETFSENTASSGVRKRTLQVTPEPIICEKCKVTFKSRKNSYAHMRNVHHQNIVIRGNQNCGMCDENFHTLSLLHEHLKVQHDVPLKFTEHTFYCESDFLEWKRKIEGAVQSSFALRNRSVKNYTNFKYYCCHRSGAYTPKEERSRRLKQFGSIKVGYTCPAAIKVSSQTVDGISEIKVSYQSVHMGHGKMKINSTFQCNECTAAYTREKNLNRHIKERHPAKALAKSKVSRKGKCPICKRFAHDALLHFSSVHHLKIDIHSLEFSSMCDFTAWKESQEKETASKYIKRKSSKTVDKFIKHDYVCHHSGLRNVCPAGITVKEDKTSEKCNITYINTHVGHGSSINHTQIKQEINDSNQENNLFIVDEISIGETVTVETFGEENNDEDEVLDKEKASLKTSIIDLLFVADSLTTKEEVQILKNIVASAKPALAASHSQSVNNQLTSNYYSFQ